MPQLLARVAVIDDHPVFADALADCLGSQPDLDVVGTAHSVDEAWRLMEQHEVDVVTVDLDLAGQDGLVLARELVERWPDLALVVVTGATDGSRMLQAVQIGVRGWVAKDGSVENLVSALRGAARGETHIPAAMLRRVVTALSTPPGQHSAESEAIERLTRREQDVLRCLMEGMSRTQIGDLLQVSPNTVRTHVQSILHKLKVHSALTAVALARRAGFGEPVQSAS